MKSDIMKCDKTLQGIKCHCGKCYREKKLGEKRKCTLNLVKNKNDFLLFLSSYFTDLCFIYVFYTIYSCDYLCHNYLFNDLLRTALGIHTSFSYSMSSILQYIYIYIYYLE